MMMILVVLMMMMMLVMTMMMMMMIILPMPTESPTQLKMNSHFEPQTSLSSSPASVSRSEYHSIITRVIFAINTTTHNPHHHLLKHVFIINSPSTFASMTFDIYLNSCKTINLIEFLNL